MNATLLRQLASCNLKVAAFNLVKGLAGGVYKKEMVAALDLFTTLPCPETAASLVAACPETLEVMASADDTFIRMTPKECRGPAIQGFEECMESFEANLRAASTVQSLLLKEATAGRVRIGFHRTRDQSPLYQRLGQIGIRKRFFSDRRQFLRDTISKEPSAFRAVIDIVCIHGVHEGRERFWNGLGTESDAKSYLQAEVMFDISEAIEVFAAVLHQGSQGKLGNRAEADKRYGHVVS